MKTDEPLTLNEILDALKRADEKIARMSDTELAELDARVEETKARFRKRP